MLTKEMLMEVCDFPRESDDGKMLFPKDFTRAELEEMLMEDCHKLPQFQDKILTPIQLHKMVDLLLS